MALGLDVFSCRAIGTGTGTGGDLAMGLAAGAARQDRDGETQTMAAEAYRALRTNLSYVSPAKPPRVIVVTSALSGDGKTTSASNLAVTLAQQNKRVLLIDAETRLREFEQELRQNELYYHLAPGLGRL